jgi:uncharacterized protein YlxP (DUF503 family)
VAPIDRQATKDFINKILAMLSVDRQATKDFIAKIPSYVDQANRKAVVDAKERVVRKICLLDLKKRPLLGN